MTTWSKKGLTPSETDTHISDYIADTGYPLHSQVHGAAAHTGNTLPSANQSLGAFFLDVSEIAAPLNPTAGARRLFVDLADGKLKVRTSAGAVHSLEEQGSTKESHIPFIALSTEVTF